LFVRYNSFEVKNTSMKKSLLVIMICFLVGTYLPAQENLNYQTPPKDIVDLVLAPSTPTLSIDGTRTKMLFLEMPELPSIQELAAPEIRVAGLRINPATNGQSRTSFYTGMILRKSLTGKDLDITGLPENPLISNVAWSPDDKKVAFTITTENAIELWVLDAESGNAIRISERHVSNIFSGRPYEWLDANHVIFTAVPLHRGDIPEEDIVPTGPVVQENLGIVAPSRTFQDLIKNPYDELLFDYFGISDLVKVNAGTMKEDILVSSTLIENLSPSPDGNFILVSTLQRPYSYLVPFFRFPLKHEVIDRQGKLVKNVAELPLAENIPIGFNAVRTGPRSIGWRSDVPATLHWAEAQDEGDPRKDVDIRDKVYVLEAPFEGEPKEFLSTTLRYSGITWGDAETAISAEFWWANRMEIKRLINPRAGTSTVLAERSYEDRYGDPGNPVLRKNQFGRFVLALDNESVYLFGNGASPEGDRPFIDRFNLKTRKTQRLWRSEAPYFERPLTILDMKRLRVLTSRESVTENPNYFVRDLRNKRITQITDFPHPYPALKDVHKQVLHYKRDDGVDLTLDLYLPAGYTKEQGPLPGFLWAYPREFKSLSAAGQVSGSPYQFTRLSWGSPIYWVTQGYAILDNTSIPIVGEGDAQPNDTFVEQLVASARAAIDICADMGVLDPNRVAVGGHSYGAFMTANLLAHSDLFAAGIARSGAYNRTFTPFGFQAEERTYWEAPDVYNRMSPFMNANKIKRPILLIHGEADNNSGTFPIQSERLFNAIKGHGGIARYVSLPFESHGYRAKESILHTLWEQHQWLERYVKNADHVVDAVEQKIMGGAE
jgi:dipeptidyl aminopeptidase/acylaminoacyl peptidase